jgi:hypothetical protein
VRYQRLRQRDPIVPIETITRPFTDAERAELQRRLKHARSPADAFMMLVVATGLLLAAWAALGLVAQSRSTLVGLVLSVLAGLAVITALGALVGAVVVRPRSAANQADRQRLDWDLADGRATVVRVTATRVVWAEDVTDRDEGPWFLFDAGDDRALWLSGPRFAGTPGFPSATFEVIVTAGSDLVVDVIGFDMPLPLVDERPPEDVARDYRGVAFEIVDGPFAVAIARTFPGDATFA